MGSLAERKGNDLVKLLCMGVSGSGKTGGLTSLVKAGYHLHIIDLDNGLDALVAYMRASQLDLSLVDYETIEDRYTASSAGPVCRKPVVLTKTAKLLETWTDGSKPEEWGPKHVLVIDSMTALGKGAYEWVRSMAPQVKDPRQWYHSAQQALDNILETVTDSSFQTNVIINTHIDFVEKKDGSTKGYATTIGKALGPQVPRHFNNMVVLESTPRGKEVRKLYKTIATFELDLKTSAPIPAEYPIETGMADIFKALRG